MIYFKMLPTSVDDASRDIRVNTTPSINPPLKPINILEILRK